MLNGIKDMINRKIAIQESADAILGESGVMDIDDIIVLGEDSEMDDAAFEEENEMDNDSIPEDKEDDEPESLPGENDSTDEDMDNEPEGHDTEEITPGTEEEDDIMNMDVDSDLPTPIGAQTGEPVNDDLDDVMHMEIDLKSNTMSDILPVPPSNAGEAIASDDNDTHHVDSGFGGDQPQADNGAGPVGESGSQTLTEGISLAGGMDGESATDSTGDPAPVDDGSGGDPTPDTATPDEGNENSVTAAVRDKVNESETNDQTDEMPISDIDTKEKLLKKLGDMTKNLEGVKNTIIDAMK